MRDSWTETTLGEIAEIQQGQNLAISTLTTGKYPVYGANGIVGYFDKWNFDRDVVALGCRGSCGTVHSVTGKVWLANNAMAIWPKNESQMAVAFIALVLETAELRSSGVISGQVQPQITRTSLSPLALTCPPLSEQRRIVDVMDSVDTYIAALQQQADGARTARNAVLHELLTAGGGDWTETTLGELVTVQKGKKPPFLGKKTTAGEPYLTADVLRGSTPSQFVPPSALTACVQLQGNETILLWDGAGAGDVFRSAAGVLASTMAKLAIKQIGLIDADYLYLVVVDASPEIKSSCRGTTVPHVSPSALTALPLTLPPRPEQQRIVGIVSAMDDVISATEKAVSNAHGLRSGLLASLLSGEHEIPETYDRLLGVA